MTLNFLIDVYDKLQGGTANSGQKTKYELFAFIDI